MLRDLEDSMHRAERELAAARARRDGDAAALLMAAVGRLHAMLDLLKAAAPPEPDAGWVGDPHEVVAADD